MASPAGGKRSGGQEIMHPGRKLFSVQNGEDGPGDNGNVVGLKKGGNDPKMSPGNSKARPPASRNGSSPAGDTSIGMRKGPPPSVPVTRAKKA